MPLTPEAAARARIDANLEQAGWQVQDAVAANLQAARGVALREFPLVHGYGFADYLLFVDGQAVGVLEAKKEGTTLTGVEPQSASYSDGLPLHLPAPLRPLPFLYESTGVETRFTNGLDPAPRSRRVFQFHRPETLAGWLQGSVASSPVGLGGVTPAAESRDRYVVPSTLLGRVQNMPPMVSGNLWPAQITAVANLEQSLRERHPRALIQMATGSGKTFTAISAIYRLIKFGGAQRVLFLVDRANLGRQTLKEFQLYDTPDDGRKFTELYNVQLLTSNRIDPVARVCITTIQRLYSMLSGEPELDPTLEEGSQFDTGAGLTAAPLPVVYNPAIPVETFNLIFTDECHRSIYHLWRQVLEYFDASLVGLTATPSKQTFGFFNQNLIMEYNHERAVADGVNVDYNVYRIRTRITEQGATVEAENWIDKRDRATRAIRWQQLDDELTYDPRELDRAVVATDQIRTILRTFKEKLFGEIFPGRTEVPKTLIFAKDDSHADDVVQIVREVFGKGNDFAQKITYRTTGKAEDLIASFRNSYNPRIAVTVDMIATGTDIKPLEVVMFLRTVRSRNFFEQMKGRGVRVIDPTDLQAVTPDATAKTHFVLVDCVGVCEQALTDSAPLERQPNVAFDKLLQAVAFGSIDPAVLSSLASRLARLDRQLGRPERQALTQTSGGLTLQQLVGGLVDALDPDRQIEAARQTHNLPPDAEPTPEQVAQSAQTLCRQAAAPLATNPALRQQLGELKRCFEQTIDTISQDSVLEAGFSEAARERARALTDSFAAYLREHRDEITALQVLYSQPYGQRLRFADVKALAEKIKLPPRAWTPELLWRAYETLDTSRVRGSGGRVLTDLVALVRYALQQDDQLVPYPERVAARFAAWLAEREDHGRRFSAEQHRWLELIRDTIASNLRIERDDFDFAPLTQHGGLGRVYEVFGEELDGLLDELNQVLAA